MKLGPLADCRHCEKPIMICRIRGGAWKPFELTMIPNSPDAVEGYLPIRTAEAIAMVPTAEIAPRQLATVRWLAVRHRCAEMLRRVASRWRTPEDFSQAITELLDMWQPPTAPEEKP